MIEVRVPAFRENGGMTTLVEMVQRVDGSAWSWRLLQFEGTANSDSNLDASELERTLERVVQGMEYSWSQIVELAESVYQAIDVTLVAFDAVGRSVLVLEACDSTYWRILADEDVPAGVASLEQIPQLQAE